MLWKQILMTVCGYLCGSVLFSYHLPLWLKHVDTVQSSGDHNPGTANAFRMAGVPVGILCLLLDLAKGALPVWYAMRVLGPAFLLLPLVMAAPVVGHATTPWYGFPGGKAIAVSFGVLIGLMPFCPLIWLLVFWYLFFSLVWVIHPNELRSVATFCLFTLSAAVWAVFTHRFDLAMGCALVSVMPVYKNYTDIERARQESRRDEADAAT